jgi:hypothetical protein
MGEQQGGEMSDSVTDKSRIDDLMHSIASIKVHGIKKQVG